MIRLILLAAMMGQSKITVSGSSTGEPVCMTRLEGGGFRYDACPDWAYEGSPVDVPAVIVGHHIGCSGGTICMDTLIDDYSCKDKARILLTAEDGSKHCIKFGPAATYRLGDAVELERRKK